jgi:VWFA-related protein
MRFAALVVLLAALPLGARQDAADPVFKTGTVLVQVDVVVHKGSEPVRDLTKDDFQVFDNGQRQEIAVFVKRETQTQPTAAPAIAKGYRTNRPPLTGTEPVTATVLLIDRLNTIGDDQAWAWAKMLEYLERAPLHELGRAAVDRSGSRR